MFASLLKRLPKALMGEPTHSYVSGLPMVTTLYQPGSHGYPASEHEVTLTPTTKVTRWKPFWVPWQTVSGYNVRLNDPPRYRDTSPDADSSGTTGLYGIFFPHIDDPADACTAYAREVVKRREQYG